MSRSPTPISDAGCGLVAVIAALLVFFVMAAHAERRVVLDQDIVIDEPDEPRPIPAAASSIPGLCLPLPTPIDKRRPLELTKENLT